MQLVDTTRAFVVLVGWLAYARSLAGYEWVLNVHLHALSEAVEMWTCSPTRKCVGIDAASGSLIAVNLEDDEVAAILCGMQGITMEAALVEAQNPLRSSQQ
ncbi:hypothetical protein QBC38DRAFT_515635 [Podospora fimiseda]|uniref:Uncharacterized protein n=1 Tax=Podospora fimiseda TaxID=252190 RepID=A0AAN7GQP8_9PEZI|nr:hypothetical protein QBC38DRAFT_515635 [Podospora fimiseda]